MTRHRLLCAALVSVAAALPAAAQTPRAAPPAAAQRAGELDAALDRAARAYKGAKSIRASFEQTLTNPLTGSTTVQTGDLFQQGKRWSARFSNPRGDRYVLDGRSFWIYTPSSAPRQVLRLALDPDAVANFDLVQQLTTRPKQQFVITAAGAATVSGRPARALQLVPRKESRLAKAIVWVDDRDGTVRQFELTETTGLVRRVRLSDVRFNAPIPAAEFAFTPPAGVRVIEQPGGAGAR